MTAEFYERMFNAKRVSVSELGAGRVSVELDLNGSRVLIKNGNVKTETAPGSSEPAHGLEHFGLRTDDLETAVAELKAKGVEFTMEIREIRPGFKISFLLGPENVLIELLESGD
jgi:4-hydroxyphenylpyruvate dioxygenase-like putative hemolysin